MPPKKAPPKSSSSNNKDKKSKNAAFNKKDPILDTTDAAQVDGMLPPPSFREAELEKQVQSLQLRLTSFQDRFDAMVQENNTLREDAQVQERDTLDVLGVLRAESEQKDREIAALAQQIESVKSTCARDLDTVQEQCRRQVDEVVNTMNEKDAAHSVMLQEFATIKDFRRKRHELLAELDKARNDLVIIEQRHADGMGRLERRFFEDKVRIQREANRRISDLAQQAHQEAVANLDETTRDVYRENVRLAEALKRHVEDGEAVRKRAQGLEAQCRVLVQDRELNEMIVKEKIVRSRHQGAKIKELNAKVGALEKTLSTVIGGFEREREALAARARAELDEVAATTDELRRELKRRVKEARHVKRLAQHILDQRTTLEKFFMDALHHTRQEIRAARIQSQKAAKAEYHAHLKALLTSREVSPASPTLKSIKMIPHRNEWMALIQDNDDGVHIRESEAVDIEDLSWADKERVLRVLFAQMNGVSLTSAADPDNHGDDDAHLLEQPSLAAVPVSTGHVKATTNTAPMTPVLPKSRSRSVPSADPGKAGEKSLGLELTGMGLALGLAH
ncbi:hypothetical protein SeMB42_g03446 [Synchytrium endobioticum]|uniref:Basal body-orientation factor 1 n=1 Tax=Synchytrium endobioticum TaxID=286115 RepID=A0A507CS73_9FUNG|nr:hypothetical protein SeLEV6574_g05807 [Synchytrium endobioticum]TPX47141.1 hypothetical protein SeMB42_g03446 [Synchytrium endobioticum]